MSADSKEQRSKKKKKKRTDPTDRERERNELLERENIQSHKERDELKTERYFLEQIVWANLEHNDNCRHETCEHLLQKESFSRDVDNFSFIPGGRGSNPIVPVTSFDNLTMSVLSAPAQESRVVMLNVRESQTEDLIVEADTERDKILENADNEINTTIEQLKANGVESSANTEEDLQVIINQLSHNEDNNYNEDHGYCTSQSSNFDGSKSPEKSISITSDLDESSQDSNSNSHDAPNFQRCESGLSSPGNSFDDPEEHKQKTDLNLRMTETVPGEERRMEDSNNLKRKLRAETKITYKAARSSPCKKQGEIKKESMKLRRQQGKPLVAMVDRTTETATNSDDTSNKKAAQQQNTAQEQLHEELPENKTASAAEGVPECNGQLITSLKGLSLNETGPSEDTSREASQNSAQKTRTSTQEITTSGNGQEDLIAPMKELSLRETEPTLTLEDNRKTEATLPVHEGQLFREDRMISNTSSPSQSQSIQASTKNMETTDHGQDKHKALQKIYEAFLKVCRKFFCFFRKFKKA